MRCKFAAALTVAIFIVATSGTENILDGVEACQAIHGQNANCGVALIQKSTRKKRNLEPIHHRPARLYTSKAVHDRDQWSYGSAADWSDSFPACKSRLSTPQSPIDINTSTIEVGNDAPLSDRVKYVEVAVDQTLQIVNRDKRLEIPANMGELVLNDGVYRAVGLQFHFPSEHSIDGELLAGEMQIVHQREDALGTATGFAIVSILLSDDLPLLQPENVRHQLDFLESVGFGNVLPMDDKAIGLQESFNLGDLFSEELSGNFYHYTGSMTAPPCNGEVQWFVLEQFGSVAQAMESNFKELFEGGVNNRPVQPRVNRTVVLNGLADPETYYTPPPSKEGRKKKKHNVTDELGDDYAERHHWSYKRVNEWGNHYPECDGESQSPININTKAPLASAGSGPSLIDLVRYSAAEGALVQNNGHAIEVAATFGVLQLPDGAYQASQVHFHFPSEHTLNGKPVAGEMHIVHQRVGANDTDGLAIIAILLQDESPVGAQLGTAELEFFGSIFGENSDLPEYNADVRLQSNSVNLQSIFAGQLSGNYFHYEGSLTRPPCSESVHWFVMEDTAPIFPSMIKKFEDRFAKNNNRPIQQRNDRKIVANQIETSAREYLHDNFTRDIEDDSEWTYTRSNLWEEFHQQCGGIKQSPVDIDTALLEYPEEPKAPLANIVSYPATEKNAMLSLYNTGKSLEINGEFGSMMLPDGEYVARQLRFHFPSEHTVDGELAAGEIQIVHQLAEANGTDNIAILSILLEETDEDDGEPEISLLRTLGFEEDLPDVDEIKNFGIDFSVQLGEAFASQLVGAYYHYQGSLTTPPCSETVSWYLLEQPAKVLHKMRKHFSEIFGKAGNSRPVQPWNGRAIVVSELNVGPEFHTTEAPAEKILFEDADVLPYGTPWNYSVPDAWSDDFPQCGSPYQSPIDIDSSNAGPSSGAKNLLTDLMDFKIVGPNSDLKIKNNGKYIKMKGDFGISHLPDGDYAATTVMFHFPAEHAIDGVLADGEMQIFHRREQGGGLAVISILLQETSLLEASESLAGGKDTLEFFESLGFGTQLPPNGMQATLPKDVTVDFQNTFSEQLAGPYFHYVGSTTSPPCTSNVHWYVVQKSAPISLRMIDDARSLFDTGNNRPVQLLNGRAVVVSQVATSRMEFGVVESEQDEVEEEKEWSYDRVDKWEEAYRRCGGLKQSPINVDTTLALTPTGATTMLKDLVNYRHIGHRDTVTLLNNGHTVQVRGDFGYIQLPDGQQGTEKYFAAQINFHFPSEHAIDGKKAAGEMRIVHHKKWSSGGPEQQRVAVITILLHDREHVVERSGMKREVDFFEQLGLEDRVPAVGEELRLEGLTHMSIGDAFETQLSSGYFHYEGSSTTPPCVENVHWYIARKPAAVSRRIIDNLRNVFPPDAQRPLQALNGRPVMIDMVQTGPQEFALPETEDK